MIGFLLADVVVRVEHFGYVLCNIPVQHGFHVVPVVEVGEVELSRATSRPQTEGVARLGGVAWDRSVIGDG